VKGILILGGRGTRLNLFSRRVSNKALALVYDRLVFEYPLNTLVKAGIDEIVMVVGDRYAGNLINLIGDGREFGIKKLHYVYQREAKGISDAIMQAANTIKGNCAVILGDNFFEMDIGNTVKDFENSRKGCGLFLKKVPDPKRFGVAEVDPHLDSNNNIAQYIVENIVEKPKEPKTNMAVTGLYFYDETVFEKIRTLKPSARGELEVTDLNMLYVKEFNCIGYPVDGMWNDMGTYDSILETSNFVKDNNFKLNYTIDAWKE